MTGKALTNAEQILDVELVQDEEGDFPTAILRAKTSVITTVLNTQAKVDETRLRKVERRFGLSVVCLSSLSARPCSSKKASRWRSA